MADEASLNLNIGYQDAVKAAAALGDFERSGKAAGGSTRELYTHMDALTRSMQHMLEVQRQTNELVKQGIAAQQAATQATQSSIQAMTFWTGAISAAGFAWDVFRGKQNQVVTDTVAGAQQMQTSYQRLEGTIDSLTTKLAELHKQQSSWSLGSVAGQAFGMTPIGAYAQGAFGIDPFGVGRLGNQIDAMEQQLSRTINQAVLRINVAGGPLLHGIAEGRQIGLDEAQSTAALGAMERNLRGVGLEAERTRASMRMLGVDTTNAATAVFSALDKLSQQPPSATRNSLLQQILPGTDPALLYRPTILGGQPQGGQGRYEEAQAKIVAGLRAEIAKYQESTDIMNKDPNARTNLWPFGGSVEKNAATFAPFRIKETWGQFFDKNSEYSVTEQALKAREEEQWTAFWRGKAGVGETASNMGRNLFDATRNLLNPALGGLLGAPSVQFPVTERTAEERERQLVLDRATHREDIESFAALAGRQSPSTALTRLRQGEALGGDLLRKGLLGGNMPTEAGGLSSDQEDYNQSIRALTARYKRLVAPFDEMIASLAEQNQILALPPQEQAIARARQQVLHMQRGRGFSGFEPGSIVQQDAAALAEETQQGHQRNNLLTRLTNISLGGAGIAMSPLSEQGRLRAELGLRNQLYPQYGGAPPPLSTAEQLASNANFTRDRMASGETAMKETDRAIANQKELTAAYAAGGGAAARLAAQHQAEGEAIKGLIDKSQEGARAVQLLSVSIAGMIMSAEQSVQRGRQSNYVSGMRAGAAAGGPIAIRGAEIQGILSSEFDPLIKATQDAADAASASRGDGGEMSDRDKLMEDQARLWRLRAERQKQLETDDQNRARESNEGRDRRFSRGQQDMRALAAQAAARHGVPADMFLNQIEGESGFNPNARNYVGLGHRGLGQFDPPTAARYGVDVTDPESSLDGAARYMADLRRRTGTWDGAMRSYMGATTAGGLSRALQNNPAYSRAYAQAQAAGGAGGEILERQAVRNEEQRREALGVPFTGADVTRGARQGLAEDAQRGIDTFAMRKGDTEALIEAERRRAAAVMQGVQAEQQAEDAIRVETEMRRLSMQAYRSGNDDTIKAFEALKESTLGLAAGMREATNATAQARIRKDFGEQMGATNREIDALTSGGISAMEVQQRAEPWRRRLIETGMPEGEAQSQAEAWAKTAQNAEDFKKAVLETSAELKSGVKQGVNSLVDGLVDGIGKGKSLKDTISNIGLELSKIGLDMFVKKPLGKLADNIIDGKGFNFDSGGKSSGDVLSAAFGGISKSLGGGSGGNGNILSKVFGGSGTMLGRLFGGDDSGGGGYTGGDYGGGSDFGGGTSFDFEFSGANPDAFFFHGGGRIGEGGIGRQMPAELFRYAPRLHRGGLMPDEVPIIGLKGERVLNREQTRQYDAGARGGNQTTVHAPVYIQTPNADSFRRSDSQVAAAQQRSLDRALRGS